MVPTILLSAALLLPAFVSAQIPAMPRDPRTQPKGTSSLTGQVRSMETSRPLRRALVRATSPDLREGRTATTDAEGRWTIRNLPPGRYTLSVSKGGFVTLLYGQRRPFEQGKPLELADGQALADIDMSLPKGGVITGRISDEFGEPFSGIRVTPMRYRYVGGQRRLVAVGTGDVTDDIGEYRLHGLAPGDYYVSAMNAAVTLDVSDDPVGYAPTYHPCTAMVADAQRVRVTEGRETGNVSFDLAPTRVATISGTAVNSEGKPLANAMIVLTSPLVQSGLAAISPAMVRADGSFTISNVTPGEYRLETQSLSDMQAIGTGGASARTFSESASVPLTVTGQDIRDVHVVARPATIASGRIILEGQPQPGVPAASVTIAGVAPVFTSILAGSIGRVREDWTFEVRGLMEKRVFRTNGPPGWYLKSVTINGTDVTDTGVECIPGEDLTGVDVLLSRSLPSIKGSVTSPGGKPAADYTVVLFADDSHRWASPTRFVRTARPDKSGAFSIDGVPPERYLIVALEYLEPGEEGNLELLDQLRGRAERLTVREGETPTVTLRLIR